MPILNRLILNRTTERILVFLILYIYSLFRGFGVAGQKLFLLSVTLVLLLY